LAAVEPEVDLPATQVLRVQVLLLHLVLMQQQALLLLVAEQAVKAEIPEAMVDLAVMALVAEVAPLSSVEAVVVQVVQVPLRLGQAVDLAVLA
jgi:hypothetical protein